jgi:hypothetical protein
MQLEVTKSRPGFADTAEGLPDTIVAARRFSLVPLAVQARIAFGMITARRLASSSCQTLGRNDLRPGACGPMP